MDRQIFRSFKGRVTGEAFIGRTEPLAMLTACADEDAPQHVSLYGLPHVGKTSLVQEWKERVLGAGAALPSGRAVLILDETVQAGEDAGCAYLFRRLMRGLLIWLRRERQRAVQTGAEEVFSEADRMLSACVREGKASLDEALQALAEGIRLVGRLGLRTVMILDEFERAGQFWSEEDYLRFMQLLMDRSLDLFCVAVSRPHISYVVSGHVQKVCPFRPYLLHPFSDEDMEKYLAALHAEGGPQLAPAAAQERLGSLLYVCGRSPYLLALMASDLIGEPDADPMAVYRREREKYETHFADVVSFMLYEERQQKKSFTHIVKCYFGTSDDYGDIIGTYIGLGYIESIPEASPFCGIDDRWVLTDPATGERRCFTTVSPAFVNYLFRNMLGEVTDTRDLLTGLVHSLRDIIREELSRQYSPETWNEELLKRMYAQRAGVSSFAVKKNGIWRVMASYELQNDHSPAAAARVSFIAAHAAELIRVSPTSLGFVVNEFNEGVNTVMPAVDPVNLLDTYAVIAAYPQRFAPYFGILGSFAGPHAQMAWDALKVHLGAVQDARNSISHFSRYNMGEQERAACRIRCVYLLRSMYSWIGIGIAHAAESCGV